MGYMKGSFGDVQFKWVVGYKISACWTPMHGFQGMFFVYVWDRTEAASPFEQAVSMGDEGRAKRGTLELADDERSYKFENIDLESAQVGATRRERYRLFEFRYDPALSTAKSIPVTLSNTSKAELKKTALGDDYKFSLSGKSQYLLGFRGRLASSQANAVRFVSLRAKENSFVEKIVEANNQNAGGQEMKEFTVDFSQGKIQVNQTNLLRAYVDESYGQLSSLDETPMSHLSTGDEDVESHVRIRMDDYTHKELLQHDATQNPHEQFLKPHTVQSATFVFNPGYHQGLQVT